jgi:hypothetical protein
MFQATGGQLPAAPGPQDVPPTAYASAVVPLPGLTSPPLLLQSTSTHPSVVPTLCIIPMLRDL